MRQFQEGRRRANQLKEKVKLMLESFMTGERGDEHVVALTAMGEVTAELGLNVVGPQITRALFLELANRTNESIESEWPSRSN